MKKRLESLSTFLESKKISRKTLILALILIVLLLLAILVGLIIFNHLESKAIKDHPLVLIQTPENRTRVDLGQEVILHATARSQKGIARIELWVDGSLVVAQDTAEGEILSPAVLYSYWEPVATGPHTLVVQAISNSGVRGQATVMIYAQEGMAAETEAEANISIEPVSLSLEEDTEDETGAAPGGPAPSPGGSPPGSGDDVRDYLADEPFEPGPEDEPVPSADGGEPTALKVEILALETMQSYEGLHCYVSFGLSDIAPSQWYPDFDGDQTTDDSFPSSDGRNWDVEPYLAGGALPTIYWPEDQPLGINMTCVGIADAGMAAPELGQINLVRRPETWDGITRRVMSEGGEGSYTIDYRISKEGETPEERVEKTPDPDMTIPTNLRVQNWTNPFGEIVGQSLTWDYEPEDDELPIDGYVLYLNGTMQWTTPDARRFTDIPSQWFRPPCGETYEFTVTAYRGPDPVTGFESYPSEGLSFYTADIGDPICEETYLVSFNTMTTGELYEGRLYDGMLGGFYVNDESVAFSGRCEESGICGEVGLYENYEYDLPSTTDFLGDGPSQFLITRGDDLTLSYGFVILSTYTTGLGSTSTPRICYNDSTIAWIDLVGMIDPIYEHTIPSHGALPGFCEVHMTIEPVSSGPSAAPGAPLPLPYLSVEELSMDDTGWLQIQVRNEGNADWTHNIPFALSKNSGEEIGSYTWPSGTIPPGGRTTLEYNLSDENQPMDVCVTLDPENVVPEQDDRFASPREPHCHPLPDLEIFRVSYDPDLGGLRLIVDNHGGTQEYTDLSVQVEIPDHPTRPILHSNITLHGGGTNVIEVPGINEEARAAMMNGYSVTVDPMNTLVETNEDNNTYTVGPSVTLRLHWYAVNTFYYRYYRYSNSTQQQRFNFDVTTGQFGEISSETDLSPTIADWSTGWFDLEREVQSGPWEGSVLGEQQHNLHEWVEFTIAGDEYLYLSVSGKLKYRSFSEKSLGSTARALGPPNYGAGRTISADEDCWYVGMGPPMSNNRQRISVRPPYPWTYYGTWRVTFYICRVE